MSEQSENKLSVSDASAFIGCSYVLFQKLIDAYSIPFETRDGKQYFERADLEPVKEAVGPSKVTVLDCTEGDLVRGIVEWQINARFGCSGLPVSKKSGNHARE
jgi:hypothetical protein